MSHVVFSHVGHVYRTGGGSRVVLQDVDVTLTEHRVGIIGANGSGKSTFARMVNGLVVPSDGVVTVSGFDTRRDGAEVRGRVGFCFTDPDAQIIMPTVGEDVAFGLRKHRDKERVGRIVENALLEFGLTTHADHPSHLLSGGQKQMLALASVLVTEPEILVLDEPTTLLDLRNTNAVANVIDRLPQQVLLVTHDLGMVADFDRVLVFDEARLVHDGPPAAAVAHYRDVVGGAR